jgi:hypothetical protein
LGFEYFKNIQNIKIVMEKSSLQNDMEQSEEEFRKQFDKDAPQFHNGDVTVVPVGG